MGSNRRYNSSTKVKPRVRPLDRGANYNAFGRDPDGRLAFLAALFWGPNYIPEYTAQQFAGPPEPPRYGPPARYQMACLPEGWTPRAPPNFYGPGIMLGFPFLDPPRGIFHPGIFAALQHIARFQRGFRSEDVDGYSTESASETEMEDEQTD